MHGKFSRRTFRIKFLAIRIAYRKMISCSYPISWRWCVFNLMACIYRQFRSYLIYPTVAPKHVTRYRYYRRHISILSTRSRLNQIGQTETVLLGPNGRRLPRRFQASLNTLRNIWGQSPWWIPRK